MSIEVLTESAKQIREMLQGGSSTLTATMMVPTKSLGGSPTSLFLSRTGWLWTVLNTHVIAKVSEQGLVMVVAGKSGTSGYEDGNLVQARFNFGFWLSGIGELASGEIVFTDTCNHVIRYVHADESAISTMAGSKCGHLDGPLSTALFNLPSSLIVGYDGSMFIADAQIGCVRRIYQGYVTTLCKIPDLSMDWTENAFHPDIPPLISPTGMICTPKGQLVVSDSVGNAICRVSSERVAILTGGNKGFVDGALEDAQLSQPTGLYLSPVGDLYICDSGNHAIRGLIEGQITTLFSPTEIPGLTPSSQIPGTVMGSLWPRAIVLGRDGKLFVADLQGIVVLAGPAQFSIPLPPEMIQEPPCDPLILIGTIILDTLVPCLERLRKHNQNVQQPLPLVDMLELTRSTQLLLCYCAKYITEAPSYSDLTEPLLQRIIGTLTELVNTPHTSVLILAHITKLKELFNQFLSNIKPT